MPRHGQQRQRTAITADAATALAVAILWSTSVSLCDSGIAVLLSRGVPVSVVLCFANGVAAVASHFLRCSLRPAEAGSGGTGLHIRRMLWLAASNTAALALMFFGLQSSDMASTYAFKTTEPLMTFVLSSTTSRTVLAKLGLPMPAGGVAVTQSSKQVSSSASRGGGGSSSPSLPRWVLLLSSLLLISIGCGMLTLCVSDATQVVHEPVGVLQAVSLSWVGALILWSNACLALRTLVLKDVVVAVAVDESEEGNATATASTTTTTVDLAWRTTAIFGAVSRYALVVCVPWCLVTCWWTTTPPVTLADCALGVAVGCLYMVYQTTNGVMMRFVSPVSYSVLKQARVALVFLGAFVLRHREAPGAMAWVGITAVALGSCVYAQQTAATQQHDDDSNNHVEGGGSRRKRALRELV